MLEINMHACGYSTRRFFLFPLEAGANHAQIHIYTVLLGSYSNSHSVAVPSTNHSVVAKVSMHCWSKPYQALH